MGGTPIGQSNRSPTLRGFSLAALLIAAFSLLAAGDLGDPGSEFLGWRVQCAVGSSFLFPPLCASGSRSTRLDEVQNPPERQLALGWVVGLNSPQWKMAGSGVFLALETWVLHWRPGSCTGDLLRAEWEAGVEPWPGVWPGRRPRWAGGRQPQPGSSKHRTFKGFLHPHPTVNRIRR